ncbi:hypothetical protein [Endozoicomonas sp. ONNA2]|uniref:hypothetical protein n=1 Tax=Endozoicomonas sp. ONNA2 TaxID=2828741 RepID=UPI00214961A6|nr:hypothetical protein [Endozoicomonas sp. ONNA2]
MIESYSALCSSTKIRASNGHCTVCLDDCFNVDSSKRYSSPPAGLTVCGHIFHKACLDNWHKFSATLALAERKIEEYLPACPKCKTHLPDPGRTDEIADCDANSYASQRNRYCQQGNIPPLEQRAAPFTTVPGNVEELLSHAIDSDNFAGAHLMHSRYGASLSADKFKKVLTEIFPENTTRISPHVKRKIFLLLELKGSDEQSMQVLTDLLLQVLNINNYHDCHLIQGILNKGIRDKKALARTLQFYVSHRFFHDANALASHKIVLDAPVIRDELIKLIKKGRCEPNMIEQLLKLGAGDELSGKVPIEVMKAVAGFSSDNQTDCDRLIGCMKTLLSERVGGWSQEAVDCALKQAFEKVQGNRNIKWAQELKDKHRAILDPETFNSWLQQVIWEIPHMRHNPLEYLQSVLQLGSGDQASRAVVQSMLPMVQGNHQIPAKHASDIEKLLNYYS